MVLAYKNRHIDSKTSLESLEINPCPQGEFIADKGGKDIQWGEHILFGKWGG